MGMIMAVSFERYGRLYYLDPGGHEPKIGDKVLVPTDGGPEIAEGVWAPAHSPAEVLNDPQALENGFVTPVTDGDGETYLSAASPGQFDERPVGALRSSPSYGQHSDEVMRELGLTDAQIAGLRTRGVVV